VRPRNSTLAAVVQVLCPYIGHGKVQEGLVRFVKCVAEKSLSRTFTSIADELGFGEKTVRNIFHDHIDEKDKVELVAMDM
jgi:hypothetical protein